MQTRTMVWAVALGVSLLGFADPANGESVEVTASALNVRTGPSTKNGKVGLVFRRQVYPVLERRGSWARIHLGSRSGWSHGGYLRTSGVAVFEVTASVLNVRSGASTRYRVLGTLRRGTPVAVAGSSGSWRKIAYAGRTAWVHGNYLRAAGSTPPPPTTRRPKSAAGFIQLATSTPGLFGYYSASRRWGTPRFIYGIQRIARRWTREQPGAPRIGVGDISAKNGGYLSGHASHRLGVDADFRPVRSDGREATVTIHQSAYSRSLTRHLLLLFEDELPVTHIFFNDSRISTPHRQYWRNHDNHFHVRIRR